jgi:hypothetical protein
MRSALVLAVALAACDTPSSSSLDLHVAGPDLHLELCSDDQLGDAGVPPTFANVERIFDTTCASLCHIPGFIAVDLSHGHAWANLVGRLAPDPPNRCGGPLVTPGDVSRSYLYVKLTRGLGMQCNPQGGLMPVGDPFSTPLPDCQIDLVRRWIEAGAPD